MVNFHTSDASKSPLKQLSCTCRSRVKKGHPIISSYKVGWITRKKHTCRHVQLSFPGDVDVVRRNDVMLTDRLGRFTEALKLEMARKAGAVLFAWLVGWLVGWMVVWLVGWLVGWLFFFAPLDSLVWWGESLG